MPESALEAPVGAFEVSYLGTTKLRSSRNAHEDGPRDNMKGDLVKESNMTRRILEQTWRSSPPKSAIAYALVSELSRMSSA